ncbi:hypothetical protein VP236O401_P0044 [Vibrio phage 236O40-1]|nr:hypothetical protein VP236O401_P0044 [Vibrio phage 236O40-1]
MIFMTTPKLTIDDAIVIAGLKTGKHNPMPISKMELEGLEEEFAHSSWCIICDFFDRNLKN